MNKIDQTKIRKASLYSETIPLYSFYIFIGSSFEWQTFLNVCFFFFKKFLDMESVLHSRYFQWNIIPKEALHIFFQFRKT